MRCRFTRYELGYVLICILLFFCAMNYQAKFHYFVYATLLVMVFIQKKILLNNKSWVYFALSAIMSIYNVDEGLLSMLRCFSYFTLYIVGYNMTSGVAWGGKKFTNTNLDVFPKTAYAIMVVISLGSFLHYMFNAFMNAHSIIGRNTIDIWSGEIMAATGQAALACLMLGFSVSMIFMPIKKRDRYLGIIAIVSMLAYNLVLAGRTMIVILGIVIALGFIYTIKVSQNNLKKIKLSLGIFLTLCLISIVFIYNIGGIRDYVMQSNFIERFGLSIKDFTSDSMRASNKYNYILNGWKHPFGGLNLFYKYGYAHDLLLDGYDEYGIIVFFLLCTVLFNGVKSVYKLIRYSNYDHGFKLLVLCIYCAILLEFCVEPILAGMSWLFVCYSLINGCMDGLNKQYIAVSLTGVENENFAN